MVFPNPVNDQLFVKGVEDRNETIQYEVVDMSGRIVMNGQWAMNETSSVNTSTFQEGIYILRIFTTDGVRKTQFVKAQ